MPKAESEYFQPALPNLPEGDSSPRYLSYENIIKGEKMVKLIRERNLWQEMASLGRDFLFVNLEFPETAFICQSSDWRIKRVIYKEEHGKYGGLILIFSSQYGKEFDILKAETALKINSSKLREKSPLYLIEPKELNIDKNLRKSVIWESGFIKPSILTGISQEFILWEAIKQGKRKAIDLTNPNMKFYQDRRNLWARMNKGYEKNGWKITNASDSELLKRLKNTSYPPGAVDKLRSGFGVEVEGRCGCKYKITLGGNFLNLYKCKEDINCLGKPEFTPYDKKRVRTFVSKSIEKKLEVDNENIYKIGYEIPIDDKCFCSTNFVQNIFIEKSLPKGRVRLIIDTYCPHDGHTPEVNIKHPLKKLSVPLKNIIKIEEKSSELTN